jgi:hypothetical protein
MKKLLLGAFFTVLVSGSAYAAVSSDVALVEDADGTINQAINYPLDTYQQRAACGLYKKYSDIYDAIFIFTTYSVMLCTPSGYPVKEAIQGIGRDIAINASAKYCSANARLKQAVKMCGIDKYPVNPDDVNGVVKEVPYSGIEVVAHEFGHYYLAMADFSQEGTRHCMMRSFMSTTESGDCDGYRVSDFGVHWSFLFNNPSVMFGSEIEDEGGGSFKVIGGHPKYSPLDQYLMGLRSPESVPPMFIVKTYNLLDSGNYPLKAGDTKVFTETDDGAERWDLTIKDIVDAMGERKPAQDPCHWKAAFVIVYPKGVPPTSDQIAKVEAYRTRWEMYYDWATDHKGSMDTTLDGHGTGTATCKGTPTVIDAGVTDAGFDAGTPDASSPDSGKTDAGKSDGGFSDGSTTDGGFKDGGAAADSGTESDSGQPPEDGGSHGGDSTEIDGGSSGGSGGCSCSSAGL